MSAQGFVATFAALTMTMAMAAPALASGMAQPQPTKPAVQSGPVDLGDVLFGKAPAEDRGPTVPHLARFRIGTGDTFVLELASNGAFMKYDDSGEVWALNPTPGPRGDTFYKNDVGELMLRTTRMGGLTVFTRERPDGMAAGFSGAATDLHDMLINTPIALFKVLANASFHATHAAGHVVVFEAKQLDPGAEPVFADAANLAAQAFFRVDHHGPAGHQALARYNKVAFLNGRPPGVKVVGEEVRITVTPDMGFAGRPSSQRISQVLFRR